MLLLHQLPPSASICQRLIYLLAHSADVALKMRRKCRCDIALIVCNLQLGRGGRWWRPSTHKYLMLHAFSMRNRLHRKTDKTSHLIWMNPSVREALESRQWKMGNAKRTNCGSFSVGSFHGFVQNYHQVDSSMARWQFSHTLHTHT